MNIKKIVATTLSIPILGLSGGAVITQQNISNFKSDLEIMGVQTEQAKNLSEYFNGNWLVGKRETISISEMQAIVSVYNKVIEETGEVNLGQIQDPKDLTKKLNQEISKSAKEKKNK